jgi:hypothetical protein
MKYCPFLWVGILFICTLACQQQTTEKSNAPDPEVQHSPKTDYFLEQGALLGIHFGIHKPQLNPQAGRNFMRYEFFPNWKGIFPGSESYYLRPDRGPRLGTEGFLWVFQDKEARNAYFPEKDFPSEKFEEIRKSIDWLYRDSTFFKYFQYGLNSSGFSSDYEVIAMSDSVGREWLSEDAVIVLRHYRLRPDADSTAFESFLQETWKPAKSMYRPNAIGAFLKVIRGYQEDAFAELLVFENTLARNEVFPYGGSTSAEDSLDQVATQLMAFLEPIEGEEGHYEIIF